MIIAALDTSTHHGSVAVRDGSGRISTFSLPEGRPHSETLLPAIDDLLRRAGLRRGEVEAIAVGTGPGAFTGLRVGLASVKGWAFAADLPVLPVPSLAAVAYPLLDGAREVVVIADARKGETYLARYTGLDRDGIPALDGQVQLLTPAEAGDRLSGLAGNRVVAVGTGLDLVAEALAHIPGVTPADPEEGWPSAGNILLLGERMLAGGRSIRSSELVPFYVRPPDAKAGGRGPVFGGEA